MSTTDPIADMLSIIKNGIAIGKEKVDLPNSQIKKSILEILKKEGYISNLRLVDDKKQGILRIYLKYVTPKRIPAIRGLKRVSRPGLRVYAEKNKIPYVLKGQGTAILSTSKGLLSDKDARAQRVGGEVICFAW